MQVTLESAQGHTDSIKICAVIDQEFYHFDVAVDRSHMQGSSVVVAYGFNVNEGDFKIGAGKYQ
jgi:hypothetical protein